MVPGQIELLPLIATAGKGLIATVIVVVVAHWPAVGVKV
jgi:hypothetical protein